MRRLLALAALLAACSDPPTVDPPRDAGEVDAGIGEDARTLTPWEAYGCEPSPWCISVSGGVAFCDAVAGDPEITRPGRLGECERWMRCADGCFVCRDWSSHPERVEAPEAAPDQPPCAVELCPYPDGGTARVCGDAG